MALWKQETKIYMAWQNAEENIKEKSAVYINSAKKRTKSKD